MYNILGPSTLCSGLIPVIYLVACAVSPPYCGGRRVEREDASFLDNEKLRDLSCAWIVLLVL